MIGREDMEKAFPPVLSNLNLVVVAGYGSGEIPPVYAFRPLKHPPLQGFFGMVGRQGGQIIQSPPEQASKSGEENP